MAPSLHTLCYDMVIEGGELFFHGPHVAGMACLGSLKRLHLCMHRPAAHTVDISPLAQALLALQGGAAAQDQAGAGSAAAAAAAAGAAGSTGSSMPGAGLQKLCLSLPSKLLNTSGLVPALATAARKGKLTHLSWSTRHGFPLPSLLRPFASTLQQLDLHVSWGADLAETLLYFSRG